MLYRGGVTSKGIGSSLFLSLSLYLSSPPLSLSLSLYLFPHRLSLSFFICSPPSSLSLSLSLFFFSFLFSRSLTRFNFFPSQYIILISYFIFALHPSLILPIHSRDVVSFLFLFLSLKNYPRFHFLSSLIYIYFFSLFLLLIYIYYNNYFSILFLVYVPCLFISLSLSLSFLSTFHVTLLL